MSETTPETSDLRDRLAEALCPPHHRAGWASMLTDAQGRTTTQSSPRVPCHLHRSHAQALLPVVAQEIAAAVADARADEIRGKADSLTGQLLIAAAEQRGREEVRARVEALLPIRDAIRAAHHEMEDRGQECGCSYKDCYECGKWHNCTHGTTGLANDIRAALAEPAAEEHP